MGIFSRKWDYQENYSSIHCAVDGIEFQTWKHAHWLWWGCQSIAQWFRDKGEK